MDDKRPDRNLLLLHEDVAKYLRDNDEDYRKENIGIFYTYLVANLPLIESAVKSFEDLPETVFKTLKEDKERVYRTSKSVGTKDQISSLLTFIQRAERDLQNNTSYYERRTLEVIQRYLAYLMYAVDTSEFKVKDYPLIMQLPRFIQKQFKIMNQRDGTARCKIVISGGTTLENSIAFSDLSFKSFGTSLQRERFVSLPDPSYDPTYGGRYTIPDKPTVELILFPADRQEEFRDIMLAQGFEESKY